MASSIMSVRANKPDLETNSETQAPGSEMDPGLKSACEDIIRAVNDKSPLDLAKALQNAVDCMEGPKEYEE